MGFDSVFVKLLFRIRGGMKFGNLSGRHWHWWPEFNNHSDIMLTCVLILIIDLCVKKPMKGCQKGLFCYFLFLGVLWLFMGNWWWGGAESLVKGQLKLHILLIDSAKTPKLDGIISPSGLYGSGINHREWRGEVSSRFPLVSTGVCKLPLKPTASEMVWFSACGVFVDD